jgi:hypothetical protein
MTFAVRFLCTAAVVAATLAALPIARAAESSRPDAGGTPGEAKAQRIVNEDEQVRIEELRVRGETQRITVQPKAASAPAYEIVTHDVGSKAPSGERVWHILGF